MCIPTVIPKTKCLKSTQVNWHVPGLYKDKYWKLRAALCEPVWPCQKVGSVMSGDCGQATDPLVEPQLSHSLFWMRVVLYSVWCPVGALPK